MIFKNIKEIVKDGIYVEYVGINKFTTQTFNNRSHCFCKKKIYYINKKFYSDLSHRNISDWKIRTKEEYLKTI